MFTMQGKWAIDRHITSKTYNLYLQHEVFNIIYRFSIFLSPFWWWFHQYLNHVTWLESCDVKHGGRFGFCSVITFGTFCQNFFKFSLPWLWVKVGDCLALSPLTDWISAWSWAALVAGSLANLGRPLSLLFSLISSDKLRQHTSKERWTRLDIT